MNSTGAMPWKTDIGIMGPRVTNRNKRSPVTSLPDYSAKKHDRVKIEDVLAMRFNAHVAQVLADMRRVIL